MNRHMLSLSGAALLMMGAAGASLHALGSHQQLAPPGVVTHPLPDSIRLEADLPEHVLNYQSERRETEAVAVNGLPQDTSFGYRRYRTADGFYLDLRVVLMGRDRTSMHKPQFCLTGQGWQIDDLASSQTTLRIEQPYPYDLPVAKLVARTFDEQKQPISGVYVYWYVASDALSASTSGFQRMWWTAEKLIRTGVMQRWAYVSCFAPCAPGQEAATFERMKRFIPAAVPQFQLYPPPKSSAVATVP